MLIYIFSNKAIYIKLLHEFKSFSRIDTAFLCACNPSASAINSIVSPILNKPSFEISWNVILLEKLSKLTPEKAIARYVRAVAERGMRLLYVRPFISAPDRMNVLQYNIEYIKKLKSTLEQRHFQVTPIYDHVMSSLLLRPNIAFLIIQ